MREVRHEYKDFSEIPSFTGESVEAVKGREAVRIYHPRVKEKVINGDIKWKPVDVVAARVVAKAPWYCAAPEPGPKFGKKEERKMSKPEFEESGRIRTKKAMTEDGYVEEHYKMSDVAPIALDRHEKLVKESLKNSEEMTQRANDAIAAIDYLATQIRGPWTEYQQFIKGALGEVREQRIALSSETRLLMIALREVRQFFLEEAYETEINRLHEFIDLCERLKALRESGFLDAVADTILKLSEGAK